GEAAAIQAATSEAARLLRCEHELGDIFEGAIADLLLLKANPLEDIQVLCGQGDGIKWVMKEGQLISGTAV
ncbi:MAG TPA: peptidase M38, partial [Lautropia sp.]|nr:peptidase M38 [Lautropia sp.]